MPCPGCAGGPWMMALWIIFLIVLVVGMVLLARALWNRRAEDDGRARRAEDEQRSRAIAILEERFARGEIDEQELEQRRRILQA